MKALVTGATGLIGRRLLPRLEKPVILSRHAERARSELAKHGATVFHWDAQKDPAPAAAFEGVDTVIHLAGEPVAEGRWTPAKKALIRSSRVEGTRRLVQTIASLAFKPKVLVSASAVGYYGNRGDEELPETAPPDTGFLPEVCVSWEREAKAAMEHGVRVVTPRIGVVLSGDGGALGKMLMPFKFGLGSPVGNGRQYMPWIHVDDVVSLLLFVAENEFVSGPVNATSPHPVTNREFTKALGRALGRPTFMPPVPGFALKAGLGEFGAILLESQRTRADKILNAGFRFAHPELDETLRDVLKR